MLLYCVFWPARKSTNQMSKRPLSINKSVVCNRMTTGDTGNMNNERLAWKLTNFVDNLDDFLKFIWADVWTVRETEIHKQPFAIEVLVCDRFAGVIDQLPRATDGRLPQGRCPLLLFLWNTQVNDQHQLASSTHQYLPLSNIVHSH